MECPNENTNLRLKVGAAQLLQARPEQRVPEGAAAAQGAQDRRDLDQEELPKQRGTEDLKIVSDSLLQAHRVVRQVDF